jgi:hypothetical protein
VNKLIFIFFLIAFSCSENKVAENSKSDSSVEQKKEHSDDKIPQRGTDVPTRKSQYSFEIMGTAGNFGYQIFDASGKMTINQPTIPAIQGNKGFLTEKDAQKAAEFVIQKIDRGIFPPTFSVAELDSLGLKY